jgi:hypothetical protein
MNSAQSIAHMSRGAFARKYASKLGGDARANEIYGKARRAAATALTLFSRFSPLFYSTAVTPMPTKHDEIPDWETLFGSHALCECEHCRSVYSPAAYLADLLAFLKDGPANSEGRTPLQVLFQRRPDIGDIEFSCENTNTLIPYVDLVNEVLENAVSSLSFSTSLGFENDLDKEIVSSALKEEFKKNRILLSSAAIASVDEKSTRWAITDGSWRYAIKKESGKLEILAIPQTRGTPEELTANPEHLNPRAYDELAKQVYRWDLPFDLWTEEARVYLQHLGVPRDQLMQTFQKPGPPAEPTDLAIATEYLGLTSKEREIITGSAPEKPWEFWGLTENANTVPNPTDTNKTIQAQHWLEALSRVTVILNRSGLSYKQMLELL